MFSEASVILCTGWGRRGGSLPTGGLPTSADRGTSVFGSLSRGSLSGCLCPGWSLSGGFCWGSLSRFLCQGVSVQGVSFQGVSFQGSLSGGSMSRAVSFQGVSGGAWMETPSPLATTAVGTHPLWNAFLL